MLQRRVSGIGVLGAVVVAWAGCAPPPPAPPPTPEFDAKAVFRDLARGSSRPMVVDWTPDDRAALETRANRGAILVRFTEEGIEPMWDCVVPDAGRYEYTGVSPKRDHVDARSTAELAANFPAGFAKFQAMMKSGQALSAEVRMIGVAELNRLSIRKADLPRGCERATHFVKELTIGGFQFGAAAERAAGAGASAFGAGAEGGYAGVSNRITEEGDFRVCESADPDSRTAPSRCKGILRIRLVPIDQDATQVAQTCGAGLRWDGRACVQIAKTVKGASPASLTAQPAFECTKGNARECLTQCKEGNAASCTFAAQAMVAAKQGSLDEIKTLYQVACKGKHYEGCSGLADVLTYESKESEAATLYGVSCLNGFAGACTNYGVSVYFGRGGTKEDRALAFKLWERACRLGDFVACSNAGVIVRKGEGGIARNDVLARQLFDVACRNNDPGGCSNLGSMFENGIGGAQDKNEALRLYMGACEKNNPAACVTAGLLIEESNPADKARVAKALSLYEKACDLDIKGDGCASFAENKALLGQYYSDVQLDRRSCDGSTQSELGCFNAAFVYANEKSGFSNMQKMADRAKRTCKSAGVKKAVCANFR